MWYDDFSAGVVRAILLVALVALGAYLLVHVPAYL